MLGANHRLIIIIGFLFCWQIEEVELPFDRVKNQRRAYVFISYETEEIVERVIANPKQKLGGKDVSLFYAPKSLIDLFLLQLMLVNKFLSIFGEFWQPIFCLHC